MSSVSRAQRFRYFQILCYALERWARTPFEKGLGVQVDVVQKFITIQNFGHKMVSQWKFEWNIFPGFTTLQHCYKVQEFMSKMSAEPEDFTGRIIFMSMFNDISWRSKDNEQECELSSKLVSIYARRFPPGRWSFLGLGSEKKWCSAYIDRPQGEWDRVAELIMIKFSESGHPVFRATSPLSWGVLKSKGGGKLSIHFCADGDTIETVFRTFISVNQLSTYGAVSDLCDEYSACQAKTERPVLAGQSDLLFEPASLLMTIPSPSTEVLAQEHLLQKYQERVEWLSQQNRVIKFCTDAGFLTMVDVGQYFMTKDTEEFSQFTDSVACREYTLPRDEKSSDPKGWIRVNTKIGRVLEVTTSCLQGAYGMEIRIESVNKDNSHSWVRIAHGLNKLVTDLSNNKENDNNEQETSEIQFDNFALKSNARAFASRSKAKTKPQRRNLASPSTRTLPIGERKWTDVEAEDYSPVDYKTADCSSSSWSSTSRRRWSGWFLEKEGISS